MTPSGATGTGSADAACASAPSATTVGGTAPYCHDASDSRLLRSSPTQTTFCMPGMELHLDKSSGTVTATRYYSFGGQTIAVRQDDGVSWLADDHHGTAQPAVNAATGESQRRRLDPFGEGRDADSSDPTMRVDDKGFVGGTNDTTAGLTRLGARDYDASTGRFVSADR